MSVYESIGFTRRDKTPQHWRGDYRLKPKAKQLLAQIATEREELQKAHTAISEDMSLSDEEYNSASREIIAKLDALIDRADEVRRKNY
ncbi:hypothetical protein [Paenibacillus woosongensis]|uniref:Uncharacterized protein n=1 Tax=Paenibacillus woosongensis TaxID=307580 RepID=A0ABQ4MYW4_9BACL|nr:hypothetical protein [Paenibacillus woosongensis]GIP61106.1 hypothetical protein J15TS10_49200 [Paenibacillus woosongensis]